MQISVTVKDVFSDEQKTILGGAVMILTSRRGRCEISRALALARSFPLFPYYAMAGKSARRHFP